jgi:hypothetical protein
MAAAEAQTAEAAQNRAKTVETIASARLKNAQAQHVGAMTTHEHVGSAVDAADAAAMRQAAGTSGLPLRPDLHAFDTARRSIALACIRAASHIPPHGFPEPLIREFGTKGQTMTQAESEDTTKSTGLDASTRSRARAARSHGRPAGGRRRRARCNARRGRGCRQHRRGVADPGGRGESRAPEWVRELRKSNREKDRKLREQEAEITRLKGTGNQPAAVVVGEEADPGGLQLRRCEFETRDWKAWNQRKQDRDPGGAEGRGRRSSRKRGKPSWKATARRKPR